MAVKVPNTDIRVELARAMKGVPAAALVELAQMQSVKVTVVTGHRVCKSISTEITIIGLVAVAVAAGANAVVMVVKEGAVVVGVLKENQEAMPAATP